MVQIMATQEYKKIQDLCKNMERIPGSVSSYLPSKVEAEIIGILFEKYKETSQNAAGQYILMFDKVIGNNNRRHAVIFTRLKLGGHLLNTHYLFPRLAGVMGVAEKEVANKTSGRWILFNDRNKEVFVKRGDQNRWITANNSFAQKVTRSMYEMALQNGYRIPGRWKFSSFKKRVAVV